MPELVLEGESCANSSPLGSADDLATCGSAVVGAAECDDGNRQFTYSPAEKGCSCCTSSDALTNTASTANYNIYTANPFPFSHLYKFLSREGECGVCIAEGIKHAYPTDDKRGCQVKSECQHYQTLVADAGQFTCEDCPLLDFKVAGRCGRQCDADVDDKASKVAMLDILKEPPTWSEYGLDAEAEAQL